MNTYKGHPVIPDSGAVQEQVGIEALYPGVCARCRGPIKVGERIGKTPVGGWAHVVCPAPAHLSGDMFPTADEGTPTLKLYGKNVKQPGLPAGLPNGVWTIKGPRGHRTYRISTILKPAIANAVDDLSAGMAENFRAKFAGRRVLELLTGPDNTSSYRGLAWYEGKIGKLWKFGQRPAVEILINVFAKLVERGEELPGYTVHFARHCYKCNRLLTTPESIERGIGPTCAAGGWD